MNKTVISIFILFVLLAGCRPDPVTPIDTHKTTPYALTYPSNFPQMIVPANNVTTVEGVLLGRHLYYDTKLSKNGPFDGLSCSTCHHQSQSFTVNNPGTAVMAHINLGWHSSFLWNGKIEGSLETVTRFEIEDFFATDLSGISGDSLYKILFYNAFGSEDVTYDRASKALAQYMRSMISTNSKFDKFLKYEASFTSSELNGMDIFFTERGDCFHCHASPLFTDNSFHNIGIDSVFTGYNMGRYNATNNPYDIGKFKTPTIRNIELTAPYMHDGRFATLEEVVEFYNSGVHLSSTLDPIMTKPGKEFGLNLTAQDKSDLVAFLKTLTDTTYTTDARFSSPF